MGMSSSDRDTPDELALGIQRLRAKRERAVREARRATELLPPDYDGDDEPSVVTFKGKAADLIAERQAGLVTRIQHSMAPISRRMSSPTGKVVAVLTGLGALVAAAIRAIVWLQEQGLLGR